MANPQVIQSTSSGSDEELVARLSLRKKLLFAALISTAVFVCLEAAIRVGAYFLYHRSPYFLFYGLKSWMADDDPEGHSAARAGYFKFPPSRVLHQYGMFSQPTPIRIDSLGFRGADFSRAKPPRMFRIVCMGESSTFGFFDRDDFTYPAILERLFAERSDKRRPTVEVINAGIPHANSDNIVAMLTGEILGYSPDLITIYAGYNDAVYVMDENSLQRTLRWLHSHSATYVALKRLVSVFGGPGLHSRWAGYVASASRDYVERQVNLHVARYESNLRKIVSLARQKGVHVVFIKQPMTVDARKGSAEMRMSYHERVGEALETLSKTARLPGARTTLVVHSALMDVVDRVAKESSIPLVDNIAIVDEHPEFFASYVHLTEEGNGALARAIYAAVAPLREPSQP